MCCQNLFKIHKNKLTSLCFLLINYFNFDVTTNNKPFKIKYNN